MAGAARPFWPHRAQISRWRRSDQVKTWLHSIRFSVLIIRSPEHRRAYRRWRHLTQVTFAGCERLCTNR